METEKSWKYRVVYERAAGVGKTDGFKVEASGDDSLTVQIEADKLYEQAITKVEAHYPQVKETCKKEESK
ncbi:MAG: hypothetical protein PHV11_06815 [Candidatus Bipolaricaulis sp.]|nr:hypothetical protein [Candidatus Bipolaricaulis sp.]